LYNDDTALQIQTGLGKYYVGPVSQ